MSWPIVPRSLMDAMSGADRAAAKRVVRGGGAVGRVGVVEERVDDVHDTESGIGGDVQISGQRGAESVWPSASSPADPRTESHFRGWDRSASFQD